MTRAVSILVALWLLPAAALAQPAALGLGRRLGDPAHAAPSSTAEEEEEPSDDEGPWAGPQIQMSYAYSKLSDAYGGGDTHSAAFEVFLQWPLSELRTSVLAEAGGRDYALGGDDFVFRAGVGIGFQLTELIDPLVPHISVIATGGAVVGQRFDTSVVYGFGGAGLELGAELRVVRNLHLAASFSYLRLEMDGAAFDLFEVRVGFGL